MTNTILRKRVIAMVAMCYAMTTDELWEVYEKIGSLDVIIQALENDTLADLLR